MKQQGMLFAFLFFISIIASSQKSKGKTPDATKDKQDIIASLNSKYDYYKERAMKIWDYAEVGFKEEKSTALLQQTLKENGFTIQPGVAEMPTAFVASYGSGSPVIGILAEFDALPGMSQQAVPEKKTIEIKKLIEQKKLSGTIRVYGCPAEEGGSGKVYMVRTGLFSDVDIVIHWHPDEHNAVTMTSALANTSAKFRFRGKAAHASMAPEKGRSSLDAVEAMDNMVNMMREHVPQETRIHYIITNGGKAPNIVPDFAEVYYYVRHPQKDVVLNIFDRVVKAAQGAALGTETEMEYQVIGGSHDLLLNKTLADAMQKNLEMVGGVSYTPGEIEFGKKLQSTFNFTSPAIESAAEIKPLKTIVGGGQGSTDVGDVSYVVPTVGLEAATWIPGTPAHSWQAVACGGTDIGIKGMMVAAKTMTLTAFDLFITPALITNAKEEFKKNKGDYQYKALLGGRKPALNYRD